MNTADEQLVEKYNKLKTEFEQYKKESVKWSQEDIKERVKLRNKDITCELAQEILEDMI